MAGSLTENLIAEVVFPDEVSQQLLIDTGLVDNSSIPECASQFNCLQQNRFGFLEAQIATQAMAQPHGTEARCWDLDVAEGQSLGHVDWAEYFSRGFLASVALQMARCASEFGYIS